MSHHGFVRVAAGVPAIRVADCDHNAERTLALMKQAEEQGVGVLAFPELGLTGYTCNDLFQQSTLQDGALAALGRIAHDGEAVFSGLVIVGLPLVVDDQLFNCAAVVHGGRVLGFVPKAHLPNYKEFYDARWFSPAARAHSRAVRYHGEEVPFGADLLFEAGDVDGLTVGVEICEDLWTPVPPSCAQALAGATVLVNLSASNEVIGKAGYRRQLVGNQSGRCIAGYVYAAAGVWESTTDLVFGGHCIIAEDGVILAEAPRFRRAETLLATDLDLDRLRADRLRTTTFADAHLTDPGRREFRRIRFTLSRPPSPRPLLREIDPHPFVPRGTEQLRERCEEIFQTQVAGLAGRLEHIGTPPVSIGISGGLDSTLALLVACKTFDQLGVSRERIKAFTLPGFGTTSRTKGNAQALMKHLGVTAAEIDIRRLCLEEWKALGHRPFGVALDGLDVDEFAARLRKLPPERRVNDLVFENVQARARTSLLMNAGFVVGTGDVSELALGWCTYNADHMSMYNPNVSIPKTLVKFLVRWAAENEFAGDARKMLLDIVATDPSPELLPIGESGEAVQSTEAVVGPYELHDFFLFHFLRNGSPPEKILYLARHAQFDRPYPPEQVRYWLRVFLTRFFANQYKRSVLPDGPKVGSISLSPRGDWRMPSDAAAVLWLERLAAAEGGPPTPGPAGGVKPH
jgi:NAD+ synthase (glutamine-hydrolysing)